MKNSTRLSSVDQPYGLCAFGHQGKMHDEATPGLKYNNQRMYHTQLGRFITTDPWMANPSRPSPGDGYPDGMNFYTGFYVLNGMLDYLGLFETDEYGNCCKTWRRSHEVQGYQNKWTCALYNFFGEHDLYKMTGQTARNLVVHALLKKTGAKDIKSAMIILGVNWIALDQILHACQEWYCFDTYKPDCECKDSSFWDDIVNAFGYTRVRCCCKEGDIKGEIGDSVEGRGFSNQPIPPKGDRCWNNYE